MDAVAARTTEIAGVLLKYAYLVHSHGGFVAASNEVNGFLKTLNREEFVSVSPIGDQPTTIETQ